MSVAMGRSGYRGWRAYWRHGRYGMRCVYAVSAVFVLFLSASTPAVTLDSERVRTVMHTEYGDAGMFVLQQWFSMMDSARNMTEPDILRTVNDFFNQQVLWVDDLELWGEEDYWASPLQTLGQAAGDCEDYSIAKYITLRLLGVPNERLRLIYVNAQYQGSSQAHMVLGYYPTPNAIPQILDNINPNIVPATQRTDLRPVFSFNDRGLWVGNSSTSAADPTARVSRWGDVLQRMQQEGIQL